VPHAADTAAHGTGLSATRGLRLLLSLVSFEENLGRTPNADGRRRCDELQSAATS